MREERRAQQRRGIPLRAVVPNAVTALALCSGLTGIRFAIAGDWERACFAILIAAVLDGMDGRIARSLRAQTRFGAELDSLSDVIAFGVAPALILYLWSLQAPLIAPFGWLIALAYAVCMALRLARFNARIDAEDQPHKSAGFLTGVPAPAGAGLMLLPIFLWLASDGRWDWLSDARLTAPWTMLVAFLAISSVATYSWGSLRLRRNVRLEAILFLAILGAALFSAPFGTLSVVAIAYIALIPLSVLSYSKVKRQRARAASPAEPGPALAEPVPALTAERPSGRRRPPPSGTSK